MALMCKCVCLCVYFCTDWVGCGGAAAYLSVNLHTCPRCSMESGNVCKSQLLSSDKLWTPLSLNDFFLKPFCLPLLNHPLIQRKDLENWLSFNAATARTLSLNKVSVA